MAKPDLTDLADYYKQSLCNTIYRYSLNHGIEIKIAFYRENFCHLIGIQHVVKGSNRKNYLGESGFEKIELGELTTTKLIRYNKPGYNYIKSRLEHFTELGELLHNPTIHKFYEERVYPPTKIRADFVLHNDTGGYRLHLFAVKESIGTSNIIYAPESFIVKYSKDSTYNQYIAQQEHKKIIGISIQPTQENSTLT